MRSLGGGLDHRWVDPSDSDAAADSVQFEGEPKCVVDGGEFVATDSTDELPEPFGCDGRGLLDEDLRLLVANRNRWTKRPRRGGPGRRSDQERREHEVVRLDHDGEPRPLLLTTPSVAWCTKPMDVTTHGACPSPPGRVESPLGLPHRSSVRVTRRASARVGGAGPHRRAPDEWPLMQLTRPTSIRREHAPIAHRFES